MKSKKVLNTKIKIVIGIFIIAMVLFTGCDGPDYDCGDAKIEWDGDFVVYGHLYWETSGFPASGLFVQLCDYDSFTGEIVRAEDYSGADGYFECVSYNGFNDYPELNIYDDQTFLKWEELEKLKPSCSMEVNLYVLTKLEVWFPPDWVETGHIFQTHGMFEPHVWLDTEDDESFEMGGPLKNEVKRLPGKVKIKGHLDDSLYSGNGSGAVHVESYVILDVYETGSGGVIPIVTRPIVGEIRRDYGDDYDFYITDGKQDIYITCTEDSNAVRYRRLEEHNYKKAWISGQMEYQNRVLTIDPGRMGYLEE